MKTLHDYTAGTILAEEARQLGNKLTPEERQMLLMRGFQIIYGAPQPKREPPPAPLHVWQFPIVGNMARLIIEGKEAVGVRHMDALIEMAQLFRKAMVRMETQEDYSI